jgi:predicted nuclease of restriction endonuclease-like (RecB) superfamily
MAMDVINSKDYLSFLSDIKKDIQTSRVKAALSVNKELILLYWRIGNEIIRRKQELGWGSEVVKQLSLDLKHSFPEMKGFGERNLVYMQTFASGFKDYEFKQQLVAQILICPARFIAWRRKSSTRHALKENIKNRQTY